MGPQKRLFAKNTGLLKPKFDSIPTRLKKFPFWAVWKAEKRANGKLNKAPRDPRTGTFAKVNDVTTFSSFADAKKAYDAGGYDGIGLLICSQKKIIGVDIDDCLSGGILTQESQRIINELGTYTEKSPSGKGIRCIGKSDQVLSLNGCRKGSVELYTDRRFLTITGHRLNENEVRQCRIPFQKIHVGIFNNADPNPTERNLDSIKQSPLFKGDIAGFDSQSHAEFALCCLLCRDGITDPKEIYEIFATSGLKRQKWERQDYLDRTIEKAISATRDSYKSSKKKITLLNTEEMISNPPVEVPCVIRDFVPRGQIGGMIGDGKVGKSSLLMQMGIVVATGISKEPFFVDGPQKVLLVNVEDPKEVIHQKFWHQSKQFNNLNSKLLKENLLIADGHGKIGPLMRLGSDGNPEQTCDGRGLDELIRDAKPDLVILDTKSRLYGLEENSNDHATQWLFPLEKIAREVGCAIIIAHHTGKGLGKTTSRGGSAFDNNTRFRMLLAPMADNYLSRFQIDKDRKDDFFTLSCFSNYTGNSKIFCFQRGEAGIPILVNFAEKRWNEAEALLFDLLKEVKEVSVTRQQLVRNGTDEAKKIREQLSEVHKITATECGVLLDNLENKGRITFGQTARGKGKIILSQ
jgi:hypothetical protein